MVSNLSFSCSWVHSAELNSYLVVRRPVSNGMTTSTPYASENDVSLVEVCAVVLYDHRTP